MLRRSLHPGRFFKKVVKDGLLVLAGLIAIVFGIFLLRGEAEREYWEHVLRSIAWLVFGALLVLCRGWDGVQLVKYRALFNRREEAPEDGDLIDESARSRYVGQYEAVKRGESSAEESIALLSERLGENTDDVRGLFCLAAIHVECDDEVGSKIRAGMSPEEIMEWLKETVRLGEIAGTNAEWLESYAGHLIHRHLWQVMIDVWSEHSADVSTREGGQSKLTVLKEAGVPETLARRTLFAASVMKSSVEEYPVLAGYARSRVTPNTSKPSFDWMEFDISRIDAMRITSLAWDWEPWSAGSMRKRYEWGESRTCVIDDLRACGFGDQEARRLAREGYPRSLGFRRAGFIMMIVGILGALGSLAALLLDFDRSNLVPAMLASFAVLGGIGLTCFVGGGLIGWISSVSHRDKGP